MRLVIFLACQDVAADKDREFINHINQCDDSLCLEDFNEQSSMFNPSTILTTIKKSARVKSSGTEHGGKFFHSNGVSNFTIH